MTGRVTELKKRMDGFHGPCLRIRQISHSRLEICGVDQDRSLTTFSGEQVQAMQRIGILEPHPYVGVCSVSLPNEHVDAALGLSH